MTEYYAKHEKRIDVRHTRHVLVVKVCPGSLTFVNFIVSTDNKYVALVKNMRIFLMGIIDMKATYYCYQHRLTFLR